jgi:5-methylcytosine-specific restriction endonuclease McrA
MKRSVRVEVLERDGVCQICKTKGERGNPLTIHHVLPKHSHPELENCSKNCTVLCRSCHDMVHGIRIPKVREVRGRPRKKSAYWVKEMGS